ncbi:hypothetical protein [Sodalis-like endosymbiont of Proechinophthirus fluctus]|uniref:hypothetical protein n=1 Tax=Sodalis-like endosymbiont of Proechinophthirus fluctus TaxID=1462730 RepID=UPI000AE083D3|nr:hypothetical protein [Sodalis-like endosymbiont of Proechinophthirus fluctus]
MSAYSRPGAIIAPESPVIDDFHCCVEHSTLVPLWLILAKYFTRSYHNGLFVVRAGYRVVGAGGRYPISFLY